MRGCASIAPRRGVSAMLTLLILVALCGIVSLAVDIGRVQLARSELQAAADAAARAAANELPSGEDAARDAAIEVAAANRCDARPIALAAGDIEFGSWDEQARQFIPGGSAGNALRVTARRTAAHGDPIPLIFARLIGKESCDVAAGAVAICTLDAASYGIVGIEGVRFTGDTSTDSYDSSDGPYSPARAGRGGTVVTNGDITLVGQATINGDALHGPGHSISTSGQATITGRRGVLPSPLAYPPPAEAPATNDNASIPAKFLKKGTLTLGGHDTLNLPAGTYVLNGIHMSGQPTLNLLGPVTIYVSGDAKILGRVLASGSRPANLKLISAGGDVDISTSDGVCADVYAPLSVVTLHGGGEFLGALVGRTLTVVGGGRIHYDTSLSSTSGTRKRIALVK